MKTTGLLTPDQMQTIFINLKELISVNQYFSHQLQNALDTAAKMSDEVCEILSIPLPNIMSDEVHVYTMADI